MRYAIVIEHDLETGSFGAYAPGLPGCGAAADTREEVLLLIQEAVEVHLQALQEEHLPIPAPSTTVDYINTP